MKYYSNEEIWAGGHQPIIDFHTGLLAKFYVVIVEKRGRFIFQDLDTLEEKGAVGFTIPFKKGNGKVVKIVEIAKKQRKMLFAAGPVKVAQYHDILMPLLRSLADGNIQKGDLQAVAGRVEELISVVEPGREFASVAELATVICNFIFPDIGLPKTEFAFLSEVIWTEWLDTLSEATEIYDFNYFWIKQNGTRTRPQDDKEVKEALLQKKLIPKAAPLAYCVRRNGYSLVNGTGQEKYEKADGYVALLLQKTKSEVATSQQGLPPKWKELVGVDNFRPSALLLWLLGGRFDPQQIIRYAY